MFVGNDEIKNTISITKLKLASNINYMLRAIAAVFVVFLAVLLPNVITTLKYRATVVDIRIYDFSAYSFIIITIAFITMCVRYKQANDYFAVFPQTNTSRFLSSQILLYIWMALVSIISFLLYLAQFLVFKVLSLLNDNIILAFRTDPGFILLGIVVHFMYGILMITFFSLVAAIVRKFNTIAIALILIVAAILLTSEAGMFDTIINALKFLTKERSILIFFLKAILTWLLLLITAIVVNKYTIYYNTLKKYKNSIVAAIGIVALIIVSIIRSSIAADDSFAVNIRADNHFNDYSVWQDKQIMLDASGYEDFSTISAKANVDMIKDNMYLENNSITVLMNKKIIVEYRFPVHLTNNYDLIKVTNPKLTTELDGDNLNITYTYDKNIKVLFISPWFMMRQFDKYQNKELYSDFPDFNTTNSMSSGYIRLRAE